jgi:hypothetical protein
MPLTAPVIDDRNFDQIVAEAKTLIPRYAPEWTDHNDSDPGITLVKLFAWLTEMLIFRLNQVPELNYVKFLELLGIELEPARPARVELTFTVSPTGPPTVIVPDATGVAVAGAPGEPVVFETDRALIALRAPLAALRSFDGFSFTPLEAQNDALGEWFNPFGRYSREGSALYLGFDAGDEFPDERVDLAVFAAEMGEGETSYECLPGAGPPPAQIVWEFWHRDLAWRPLNVIRDETRAFTRSGHVELAGPGPEAGKGGSGLTDGDLFWFRARLERSSYETAPRLEMVLTNTVPATQAQTSLDEVIGGSDGSVGQRFLLANTPVVELDRPLQVPRSPESTRREVAVLSVQLEVDEGSGFEVWQEVEDFFASGSDDPHFTVNKTTGEIAFGDGERGRIPVANPALPQTNIVARRYRFGGGTRGNSGVGTITELQASVPDVEDVTNRLPSLLGSDEEPLGDAKLRAAQELKSKKRAVTAEDFERLARETPGARVRRAKALPLKHPKFPDAEIPGVVTVIVVPDGDAPNPTPNEATLRAVCAYLNAHRLLTTEVHVSPPRYRQVRIDADVIVAPAADLAEVKQSVDEALLDYFHPLRGGPDGSGWEFGGDIYFSDVVGRVLAVDGVDRIEDNNLFIWVGADRFGPCEDVAISANDLVYSTEHEIRVAYQERA